MKIIKENISFAKESLGLGEKIKVTIGDPTNLVNGKQYIGEHST